MSYYRSLLKNIDRTLIVILAAFCLISVVMISSVSYDGGFNLTRDVKVQLIAYFLGVVAIGFILSIDYHIFENIDKILYGVSIALLIAVFLPVIGKEQFGAHGWLNLGPIPLDLQPSEIVKITFILVFAKYLSNHKDDLVSLKGILLSGAYALPFIILILIEPDLGNAAVVSFIAIGMVFSAGIGYKLLGKLTAVAVVAMPIMYHFMASHQRERIDAFLNPSNMALPGNYQVWNSKIAIGSGGLFGKGLFEGTQKKLDYLPVSESDFIFAVIVEELGLIGGAILIGLYIWFLYRIFNISRNARDLYGSLIVIGVFSMFAFQIFENIGMTMGIMPVTGITLPFISYGGSSILTNMVAIGLVLSIGIRSKPINF